MKNTIIIGYGIVGHNLYEEIAVLNPDIYDIKFNIRYTRKAYYDFAFICVNTPYNDQSVCDISAVEKAIAENNAGIYIIKSTILPELTQQLIINFPTKHLVFSPEYYGATQHCNNFNFNFTILGGEKEDCLKVQQLLQNVYDGRHTFHITSPKVAMLTKYMENSFLATKVLFCIQFYELAQKLGISYEEVRELFILDPRVNPSHTFVYNDHPYFSSHCLDKDVPAIAESMDADLLKDVIKYNNKMKSQTKELGK